MSCNTMSMLRPNLSLQEIKINETEEMQIVHDLKEMSLQSILENSIHNANQQLQHC